jgi:hypothetical protein
MKRVFQQHQRLIFMYSEQDIMNGLFTKYSHALGSGEVLSGVARQGQSLHMISGSAWITVEGEPDDHRLSAGEMLNIPPGRLVVVEADQGTSRIDIRPAKQPDARGYSRGWLSILARVNAGV